MRGRRIVSMFVFVLAVLSIATPAMAYQYPLTTGEHRLTTNAAPQEVASVSGNTVVYEDLRNGSKDIYSYDLRTGAEKRLTPSSAMWPGHAAVSNAMVVYHDWRQEFSSIYCYNLSTGVEKLMLAPPYNITADDNAWSPDVSGTNVVYEFNNTVWCYDMTIGWETKLTTAAGGQNEPAISGSKIVYEDGRNGNKDIYCFDLDATSGSGEWRLTFSGLDQRHPAISGNRVVYMNGTNEIRCLDLRAPGSSDVPVKTLVTAPTWWGPRISGDMVVYADTRNGNQDIYCFDLTRRTERRLTTHPSAQRNPSISGTKVVYEDNRNGNWDIYSYELKPAASLGRPVAPKTMSRRRYYTVYGSLAPRHTKGTVVGTLQCQRYYSGSWHTVKTVAIKASDYSTYSRYKASVRLPRAGKWRMRVYHYDAVHAASYSAWRYVRVK